MHRCRNKAAGMCRELSPISRAARPRFLRKCPCAACVWMAYTVKQQHGCVDRVTECPHVGQALTHQETSLRSTLLRDSGKQAVCCSVTILCTLTPSGPAWGSLQVPTLFTTRAAIVRKYRPRNSHHILPSCAI
jgi:hypothetical protein